MPGAYMTGVRLSRAWPTLAGAIGMYLASVWQNDEALRSFVSLPPHTAIMRKYRDLGQLTSTSWQVDRLILSAIWEEATRRLGPNLEITRALEKI